MPTPPVLKIALPVPLYQYFEYRPPPGTAFDNIQVGVRVRVPFGKRTLTGIVVEKCPGSSLAPDKLKTVQEILDTEPVFDPVLKKLLFWVARYYQQPPGEVLNAALPKALRKQKHIRAAAKVVYRACTKKDTGQLLDRAPKQRQVLELIKAHPAGLTTDEIAAHMSHWQPFVRALMGKNLVQKITCSKAPARPPRAVAESLALNQEQRHAYEQVYRSIHQFGVYLLAGVTGSGKTEVYLALAKDVIERGKQVLMLVPEIGLTPQLVRRIESRLNVQVALMHSDLSTGEGAQTWLQANTGQASVVVGTR